MALNKEIELYQKISSEVKDTFLQIYNAVKDRETQLLRQIEVLAQHCKLNNSYEKCFKQMSVIFDNEVDILLSISKFGRINFNGLSCDSNFLKIEDYQHPDKDHLSLFKRVEKNTKESNKTSANAVTIELKPDTAEHSDDCKSDSSETVDSSKTANVMLECIEKQDPSLCSYETSLSKKKKSNEDKAEHTIVHHEENQTTSPKDTNTVPKYCDIVITNLHDESNEDIVQNTKPTSNLLIPNLTEDVILANENTSTSKEVHDNDNISTNNLEDLKNTSERVRKISMTQPVQVQQWMKHIISEPETEPAPNNVMEHSQIKVFHKTSL